jgi:hypothetical protein
VLETVLIDEFAIKRNYTIGDTPYTHIVKSLEYCDAAIIFITALINAVIALNIEYFLV